MATKVLRPQDLFVERFRVRRAAFYRRRNCPADENLTKLFENRKQQRRVSPKHDKRRSNAAEEANRSDPRRGAGVAEDGGGGLVMGQVTLLRRGESLSSIACNMTTGGGGNGSPNSSQIQKPESRKMALKQIRMVVVPPPADVYAGSAFFSSPSPRSVPLPSFFNKKDSSDFEGKPFDDGATRDLRRLLRLE